MSKDETTSSILLAAQDSRGRILQFAIELENIMGIYIAEYFTEDRDKIEEFFSLILSKVDSEPKYRTFLYLVEKYNLEFIIKNPNISKEIKELIEERNVFAHWPVDFSEQAIDDYEKKKSVTYVRIQKRNNKLIDKRLTTAEQVNVLIQRYWDLIQTLKTLII